jgi:RNA polymerase sigma factor (sigma-70 family)
MVQIDDPSTRTIEQLWVRYADELLQFATVLVGPSDASDVVADSFISAAPSAVKAVVRDPRAYLFRAVTNRAHDLRRSRQRRWSRDLSAVRPDTEDGPDSLIDVRRAVADLSVRQRAVVYLIYWHDVPERVAAELMGLSVGTVHRHLVRAQSHLRKALQ